MKEDTINAVSSEAGAQTSFADASQTNGQSAPADSGWLVPEFKYNLSDNPLWPDFLNELKVQREADIAESNRLADLELEQEKLKK